LTLLVLLLAGATLRPLALDGPVLDVRVADVDADGREDLVALTKEALLLFRGGGEGIPGAPDARRSPPPSLTIVGKGLLGVVRDGRYRAVRDPFGAFLEDEPGPPSLFGAIEGAPALATSPGDVDGDGRDDPMLVGEAGLSVGSQRAPLALETSLEIGRGETWAAVYRVPVPAVGRWSGAGNQLVLFHDGAVRAFRDGVETDRVPLPLGAAGEDAGAIRRNHVLVQDVDADGTLDLVVVQAKGEARLFGDFQASVLFWRGGRVYDAGKGKFFAPASALKVSGVLLQPSLVDLDGDGDLDLVLSTVDASVVAAATGSAPGTYLLFRFDGDAFGRTPAWTFAGPVPMSAFTEDPLPPVVFLPDLDRDGGPEALAMGATPELLVAGAGGFAPAARVAFSAHGRPSVGARLAAVPGEKGVLLAEGR